MVRTGLDYLKQLSNKLNTFGFGEVAVVYNVVEELASVEKFHKTVNVVFSLIKLEESHYSVVVDLFHHLEFV